jgi:hypothetical protein
MIWTPETGMVYMLDYLTSKGVTAHQGWVLQSATVVNPDGRLVAGWGLNPTYALSNLLDTLRRRTR